MERVAFLVEGTGERVECLLNPETVEVRRLAGIRPRGTVDGQLVGAERTDDPLLFTGGGRTELRLDLLFDVDVVSGPAQPADVRALTRPLWSLAENQGGEPGHRPPGVRLVWGKSWNVPAVVAAVAERFDQFDQNGAPRRSWLRLKLLRTGPDQGSVPARPADFDTQLAGAGPLPRRPAPAVQVLGSGPGGGTVRFDLLAADAVGDPLRWRELAEHNDVDDPFEVPAGTVLAVPDDRTGRTP